MDERKLLEDFLKEAKAARSEQAHIGLGKRIPKMFAFLHESGLELSEIGFKEALAYQGWLREQRSPKGTPYSPRTVLSYLGAASGFCDYLRTAGAMSANPFREIRKIRAGKKALRDVPKEKQMCGFLDFLAAFDRGKTLKERKSAYRLHVIAELSYSTGLRISETAALRPEDIDFERGLVRVREGKGGRGRVAYLNDYAKKTLRLYVEEMRPLLFSEWNERNGELLFGVKWQWLQRQVNLDLRRAAEARGTPPLTSHRFRHALGYHLHRSGCNIRHIQAILGHKLLRNTEIYVAVDKETLKEALENRHPRSSPRKVRHETA